MKILNIWVFACTSENGAPILHFKKNDFKTGKHFNVFVIFIKISCQITKIYMSTLLSKQYPFSPTHPFPEGIFHPHPYCQIRGSQSLFCKRGGEV